VLTEDISLVIIVTGPRGSGKTLVLTHYCIEYMAHAWALNAWKTLKGDDRLFPHKKSKVWSNYPVSALWKPPGPGRAVLLSTLPLDIEELMTWPEKFRDGYIVIDEIDQYADRQDWMALLPRLLVKGIKLMRHRNLTLLGSLQFDDELNSRLHKQADVLIQCKDKAFSSWGRDLGLQTGEIANTIYLDKSGSRTGESFADSHQPYPLQFFGKRYWGNYSTMHEFNVMDSMKKYIAKREVREITTEAQIEEEEKNKMLVYGAMEYFKYNNPGEKIKSTTFNDRLLATGCTWNRTVWGTFLKHLGVTSTKYQGVSRYDFSNSELDKVEV